MKTITLITLTLLLISCKGGAKKNVTDYIEEQTSFFKLRNSSWIENPWIRKTKNIKIIHESFKKFGYDKLVSDLIFETENDFMIGQQIYIKHNFKNLLDSLELSYNNPKIQTKYYSEFWNRRKEQKNDSIVYEIIKEFNSVTLRKKYNDEFVNDTLVNLLRIEFEDKNLTDQKAESNFNQLKEYGLHQSAYNLLYERYGYYDLDLNKKELEKTLTKSAEYNEPWLVDDTK